MRLGSCANLAAASLAALRESLLFVVGLSLSEAVPALSLSMFILLLLLFVVAVVVLVVGGDGGGGKWR